MNPGQQEDGATELVLSDPDIDSVGWLRGFLADNGPDCVAVINHLGRRGARIVVVAPDGSFGDTVAESVAAAQEICDRAGIDVGTWDRELTSRITPSEADRLKMRGTGR